MNLAIVPISIRDASAWIEAFHRYHDPPRGGIVAIAVAEGERMCGVAIIGRPVARKLQDGFTAEVTRVCTDGTKNAGSALYGAARRVDAHPTQQKLRWEAPA